MIIYLYICTQYYYGYYLNNEEIISIGNNVICVLLGIFKSKLH